MTEGLRLAWFSRPRSLSSSWAISLFNRFPSLYILFCSCHGTGETSFARHLQRDFDTDTHLSCIFPYITIVLLRLCLFYPKPPIGILAHPIQDREKWFVVRAGFHLKDMFDRHVNALLSFKFA